MNKFNMLMDHYKLIEKTNYTFINRTKSNFGFKRNV